MKKLLIGRCEWCQFPDLNIPAIKAKIDTGARTSAIHAFDIVTKKSRGENIVTFKVCPLQRNNQCVISCQAKIKDQRYIMSSTGHKEHRYIITTQLRLGSLLYDIELSLSNRDPLTYRLLLGREALRHGILIDPSKNCLQKKMALDL